MQEQDIAIRGRPAYINNNRIGSVVKARATKRGDSLKIVSVEVDVGGSVIELDTHDHRVELDDGKVVIRVDDPLEESLLIIEARLGALSSRIASVAQETNRIRELMAKLRKAVTGGKISEEVYREEMRKLEEDLAKVADSCAVIRDQLQKLIGAIDEMLKSVTRELERLSLNEIYGTLSDEVRARINALARYRDRINNIKSRIMILNVDLVVACPGSTSSQLYHQTYENSVG